MGSSNMAEKVGLRSSDGRVFEADVNAVKSHSGVLKNLIEDTVTDAVISVPNVRGDILKLVIQYCEGREMLGLPVLSKYNKFYDPLVMYATYLKPDAEYYHELISDPMYPDLRLGEFEITESGREILGYERRWHAGKEHRAGTINVNDLETHGDERRWHAGKEHRAGTINVNDLETHGHERSWEEKEHDASFVNQVCSKFDLDTIKGLHEAAKYLDIPSLQFLTSTLIRQAPSREFLGVVSPWLDCDGLEGYRKLEVEVC